MRKISDWIRLHVLPPLIYLFIRGVGRSMNIHVKGGERVRDYWKNQKPFILAFWHGRQLMIPLVYQGKNVHILISQHRDGELISRVMGFFGFRTIRGSTTRGSISGLKGMVRAIQKGSDLAVTPDGPKGPRHRVQKGVLEMAKLAQAPIFPVSFSASKKNSWGPGIVFSYLFLFQTEFLFGEIPFGFQGM